MSEAQSDLKVDGLVTAIAGIKLLVAILITLDVIRTSYKILSLGPHVSIRFQLY